MKNLVAALICLIGFQGISLAQAQEYALHTNISYVPEVHFQKDEYARERCLVDMYLPAKKGFATVVWFHGGSLMKGSKEIPEALKNQGFGVVGVNYRLSPRVQSPTYVHDAAAAVAWVMKNIASYGGDPSKIILSGHSAGGYLVAMVGLDKSYLQKHGLDANQLAGIVPFSGQMITHFTIRAERGLKGNTPLIDGMAPLNHIRADVPPMVLLTGDRNLEVDGRYEENLYLARMLKVLGAKDIRQYECGGYGHDMTAAGFPILVREVKRLSETTEK